MEVGVMMWGKKEEHGPGESVTKLGLLFAIFQSAERPLYTSLLVFWICAPETHLQYPLSLGHHCSPASQGLWDDGSTKTSTTEAIGRSGLLDIEH